MKTLEFFDGVVNKIDKGIAYFTLQSIGGEKLSGTCLVDKLELQENRQFKAKTVEDTNGEVEIIIEPIPDKIVTDEDQDRIKEEIARLLNNK